jgi:uncharacterized protein YjiS (DUF1127 family)
MAFSTQTATADRGAVAATSIVLLVRIRAKAHAALKALQMARMLSTLSNMSDYQLAQIGISRSDIPKYAETLMADE